MAVASTTTQLSLDRFFQIAGIHPLHGNQVFVPDIAPMATCSDPLLQYSWQNADRTGREEVAQGIADVEARLEDYLNFALIPRFFTDVNVTYPQPNNPELYATILYDPRGMVRTMKLPKAGYLISGGREVKSRLALAAPIVYTDTDSDGYFETATVTTTNIDALGNVVTDVSEVGAFYPGNSGLDTWQIRPITVSIDPIGSTVTCIFRREQAVISDLLFGLQSEGVNGLDNTAFLTVVDVYHRFLDPSQPTVQFRWMSNPFIPGSMPVSYTAQDGALLTSDKRLGWAALQAAHWDSTTQQFVSDVFSQFRTPDTVRAWFKSGYPLENGKMAGIWERCITYLTLANLDRRLCECETLRTFTEYWSLDFALSTPSNNHQIARKRLENPLGTTRAAVYAWEQIQRYRLPDGD